MEWAGTSGIPIKTTDWDKKYDIHYEQLEDFTLVYALDISKNDWV